MQLVCTLVRWRWLSAEVDLCVRGRRGAGCRLWRDGRKGPGSRLKLSLGVNKKIGRADNFFSRLEPTDDDHRIVDLRSRFNRARFEIAVSMIDKCDGPRSRLQNRGSWDHHLPPQLDVQSQRSRTCLA